MNKAEVQGNYEQSGDLRLRSQLLLIELSLQAMMAAVFVSALWHTLPGYQIYTFTGALTSLSFVRLYIDKRAGEQSAQRLAQGVDITVLSGYLFSGIFWSVLLVVMTQHATATSLSQNVINMIFVIVVLAAFVGSSLLPLPFLVFTLSALAFPMWQSINQYSGQNIIFMALLFFISLVLSFTGNKHHIVLLRIRSVTRQNALLLQNLAAARDEALKNHRQVEKASEELKDEIQVRQEAEERIRASEGELSEILEDLQDTYFKVDAEHRIIRISPSVKFLLGYSPEELIGTAWSDLMARTTDIGDFIYSLDDHLGRLNNHELCFKNHEGDEVWVSVNVHYDYQDNAIVGFEGTARDITEKRSAEELIFRQKERLRVTLGSIGEGVITTDQYGLVEYLNLRAEEMTGWTQLEAEGNPLSAVMNLIDEDEGKMVELPIVDWMEEDKKVFLSDPAMLVHKDGNKQVAIELTGASISDSHGLVQGVVLVFRDVTKLRSLAKQLAYQATHDALTALPNRVEFEKRVEQVLQSAHSGKKNHAMFFVDLDQFKAVNDTAGHPAGDLLLQKLSELLQDLLRTSDTLARLGGDEFGVLLPGCPMFVAEQIAEKMRSAVEEYRFVWEDKIFRVGLSIGVVPITSKTSGLTEIMKSADSACYVAKERGRNCVHVFQPDDVGVNAHREKMQWMQRIQQALDEDLFELHFQPIVAVSKNHSAAQLHGELLLRMINRDGDPRLYIPGAFIPTAERFHLMPQIDMWVIKHAFQSICSNINAGIKIDLISINLSGQSMGDMQFLDYIIQQIKETRVAPEKLCFEVTESAVISNLEHARQFICKLKDIGCRFSLDDFGSGLSSFDYLKNLPVDYVKLDGSLIKDVATNKVSQAMVHAINYVAHVMDMKSVAEYVESTEILEQLQRISIDYAQGYAIGKPVPFLPEYIRESRPLLYSAG